MQNSVCTAWNSPGRRLCQVLLSPDKVATDRRYPEAGFRKRGRRPFHIPGAGCLCSNARRTMRSVEFDMQGGRPPAEPMQADFGCGHFLRWSLDASGSGQIQPLSNQRGSRCSVLVSTPRTAPAPRAMCLSWLILSLACPLTAPDATQMRRSEAGSSKYSRLADTTSHRHGCRGLKPVQEESTAPRVSHPAAFRADHPPDAPSHDTGPL